MTTTSRRLSQAMKRGNPSRESGKKKGLVPPTWAKACARNARAYRNNPRYSEWCEKCNGNKVKWKAT